MLQRELFRRILIEEVRRADSAVADTLQTGGISIHAGQRNVYS
jgi:hypothetical protein